MRDPLNIILLYYTVKMELYQPKSLQVHKNFMLSYDTILFLIKTLPKSHKNQYRPFLSSSSLATFKHAIITASIITVPATIHAISGCPLFFFPLLKPIFYATSTTNIILGTAAVGAELFIGVRSSLKSLLMQTIWKKRGDFF